MCIVTNRTTHSGFFNLVFGDLKRLEYFWPHLPKKNPMFFHDEYSALHILARVGHVETFQFVAERVDEVNPTDKYGRTPLAIAKKGTHVE